MTSHYLLAGIETVSRSPSHQGKETMKQLTPDRCSDLLDCGSIHFGHGDVPTGARARAGRNRRGRW